MSWGHPEGKGDGGRGWGFYSEQPSPFRASSWAERFEASLWDFLLVAFHLVRGLGGKYGAQALKTVPVSAYAGGSSPSPSASLPPPLLSHPRPIFLSPLSRLAGQGELREEAGEGLPVWSHSSLSISPEKDSEAKFCASPWGALALVPAGRGYVWGGLLHTYGGM